MFGDNHPDIEVVETKYLVYLQATSNEKCYGLMQLSLVPPKISSI